MSLNEMMLAFKTKQLYVYMAIIESTPTLEQLS